MDSERAMEKLNDEEMVVKKVDESCDMDCEDHVKVPPSLMVSAEADMRNESKDIPLALVSLRTEPLQIESRQDVCSLDSISESSPRTPKDATFDPFAPGPDRLLLAPFVENRYSFGSPLKDEETEHCESDTDFNEEEFLKVVYDDFLEAVLVQRADEFRVSDDKCQTPIPQNLHSDVAETCPGAPVKAAKSWKKAVKGSSKRRLDFNTGLRRKLEF